MKAIMVLSNFWNWSGVMGQYLVWAKYASSIPYPPPHPRGGGVNIRGSYLSFILIQEH
jgi:hypothetical protein